MGNYFQPFEEMVLNLIIIVQTSYRDDLNFKKKFNSNQVKKPQNSNKFYKKSNAQQRKTNKRGQIDLKYKPRIVCR